jgi:hypothetical protein
VGGELTPGLAWYPLRAIVADGEDILGGSRKREAGRDVGSGWSDGLLVGWDPPLCSLHSAEC